MEINRNQFFMIGLVLLFLGLELRAIDSVILTSEFTTFLAKQTGYPSVPNSPMASLSVTSPQIPAQTIYPPEWLGWALLSIGAVLILHSLAMKRPGQ